MRKKKVKKITSSCVFYQIDWTMQKVPKLSLYHMQSYNYSLNNNILSQKHTNPVAIPGKKNDIMVNEKETEPHLKKKIIKAIIRYFGPSDQGRGQKIKEFMKVKTMV